MRAEIRGVSAENNLNAVGAGGRNVKITDSVTPLVINATVTKVVGKLKFIKTEFMLNEERKECLTKRWNFPPRNANFTGRKSLLEGIRIRLLGPQSKNSAPLCITAFHGLGGVGKTHLITEFAYQNFQEYEMSCWIPSGSAAEIEMAYLNLARDLNILCKDSNIDEVIDQVNICLSKHPRCLLIFDNAQNPESIKKYLPKEGVDVLVTSQFDKWPGDPILVGLFELQECYDYFERIVGKREVDTAHDLEALAIELGRLPLALAHAAAYISQVGIKISDYLRLYRERVAYFLAQNILPEGDKHVSVLATWDITMEKIREKSDLAPALLNFCSQVHAEGIPNFLLESFCQNAQFNPNSEAFLSAREHLQNYSMISVDECDQSCSVHRVVQQVMLVKLKEKSEDYFNLASRLCLELSPYTENPSQLKDISRNRVLLPHMEVLLSRIKRDDEKYMSLVQRILFAHFLIGNFFKRHELEREVMEFNRLRFGEDSQSYAKSLMNFGTACMQIGDAESGKAHLKKSVALYSEIFGPESSEVAKTLDALGGACISAREFQKGLRNLSKSEEIYRKGGIQCNINLAKVLINTATAYIGLGEYKKAIELINESMTIEEQYYELGHPELGATYFIFASAHLGLFGQVAESSVEGREENAKSCLEIALAYFIKSKEILERFYSNEHPELVSVLESLGTVYMLLNQNDLALENLMKSKKILEENFREHHPTRAIVLNRLGDLSEKMGDSEGQATFYKQALKIYKKNYGKSHPTVGIILHDLALLEMKKGRWTEALELVSVSYVILLFHPDAGEAHPHTQSVERSFKKCLFESKKRNLKFVQTLFLKMASQNLNEGSPEKSAFFYSSILNTLQGVEAFNAHHNLAWISHVAGQLKAANAHFRQALFYGCSVSLCCDYGFFLYSNGYLFDAEQVLLKAFSLADDGSMMSYRGLKFNLLDTFLQEEVAGAVEITVKPIFMAYYWIIRCYHGLQSTKCETYLNEFQQRVEREGDLIAWRLLKCTYQFLGRDHEALDAEETISAIARSNERSLPAVSSRPSSHLFAGLFSISRIAVEKAEVYTSIVSEKN